MNFTNYQQQLLDYINGLKENGQEAVDFLNKLMFAEGDNYGDYQCDICGHPLKYAMVIKAFYIERVMITAHPDNDVFIGTTCFKKLTSLAWLQKQFTNKYKEWSRCIDELKKGNKEQYKKIMMTVKETKEELRRIRREEADKKAKKQFEEREVKHNDLLKSNEEYKYLFEKFGYVSRDESDDEYRRMYDRPFASIKTDNEFLNDLFEKFQNRLSEKQLYWFKKLTDEIKLKDTPEYKKQEQITLGYFNTLCSLIKIRLSSFDDEFIHSLHEQGTKGRMFSEKQMKAIDKFAHKYRVQLNKLDEAQ